MTNPYTPTGERVDYGKGKIFYVCSRMTKRGVRYYTYFRGRYYPISKAEINKRILLED